MTYEYQPIDTEQRGRPLLVWVQQFLDRAESRPDEQSADFCGDAPILDDLTHLIYNEPGNRFRRFEHHIAGKSVSDRDIHLAADDLFALNIAVIIQLCGLKEGRCRSD